MDEKKQRAIAKELMNLSILYAAEPTESLFAYMQKEATRILTEECNGDTEGALFQLYRILINKTRKLLRGIDEE